MIIIDSFQEIVESIDIIAKDRMKTTSQISYCWVTSVNGNKCTVLYNNKLYTIPYYGGVVKVNKTYPISIPQNNMNKAFIVGENIPFPRQNILDNWYFVGGGSQQGDGYFPINSKGQTVYTTSGMIDRWLLTNYGTATLLSNGLKLDITSGYNRAELAQTLSAVKSELIGKTCTLTILSSLGLTTATFDWPSSTTVVYQDDNMFFLVYTALANNDRVYISSKVSSVTFYAAKLELGDTQTLARQENGTWVLNEMPNYVEESIRVNGLDGGAGYCKMPDGTLIQWGYAHQDSVTANDTVTLSVSFQKSFTAVPAITLSHIIRWPTLLSSSFMDATVTGFDIRATNLYNNTLDIWVAWTAIGRWK